MMQCHLHGLLNPLALIGWTRRFVPTCVARSDRLVRISCYSAGLLIFGLSSPLCAQREASPYVGLLQNSPFGLETTVPAIEPTLEFRGVVMENDGWLFSLATLDATGRTRSAWVGLDEPYADYLVRSFDSDSNTMQVERRGQRITLKLKLSRVQLLQAEAPPVEATDPTVAVDEKARHEVIVAETRRRRALRQANAQNSDVTQSGGAGEF